jgi:hypothetical protein
MRLKKRPMPPKKLGFFLAAGGVAAGFSVSLPAGAEAAAGVGAWPALLNTKALAD